MLPMLLAELPEDMQLNPQNREYLCLSDNTRCTILIEHEKGLMMWLAKIIPLNQDGLLPPLPVLEKLVAWDNRAHAECAAHESDWDKVLLTMKYLQHHGTHKKKVQGLASYLTNTQYSNSNSAGAQLSRDILRCYTTIAKLMLQRPLTKAYITEIHTHHPKGLPFSMLALLGTVVSNADDEALLAACKATIVAEEKVTKAGFIQLVKTFVARNQMTKEVDLLQRDQETPNAFLEELSQQVEIGSYDVNYSKNDEPGPLF